VAIVLPRPFVFLVRCSITESVGGTGRITAIRVQKRNPERANIYIDGEFAFGLALIQAAQLSKGQTLTEQEIAALQNADNEERAYELALTFLSYRPRSQSEVAQRLQKKEYDEETIQAVIQRLRRAKLVDDETFAHYWVSNREKFKPRGQYALRYELQSKGVDSKIIDAALEDLDEPENAYRAAVKRIARWRRLDPSERRRKLTAYLSRRGFGYDVIRDVWERLIDEHLIDEFQKREDTMTWDRET
jgi:regulatory protein